MADDIAPADSTPSEVWADPGRLLDALGHAVIATDLEGTVRYWGPAAEDLYGWTAAEALGRKIAELTVPELSQDMAAEIMQIVRAGGRWSGGFLVRRKDGTTFPALVTDSGLRSDDGELVGIVGVSVDVGHGLRVLLGRSSDAALILSRQAIVRYVSPTAALLFGADEIEAGRSLWDLIHPDDRPATAQHLDSVSNSRSRLTPLECRLRGRDGSWRWVEMVMSNLLDDVAVRGIVCNLHDVTDRRNDRDQLARLTDQLETALESRILIEQAKGYVIGRSAMGPDAAFDAIRRYARDHNRRLVSVAQAVVAGELPELTPSELS